MLVFSFVVSVSFAVTADAQWGSSGGTQGSRGVSAAESGLGPAPIFSYVGPGADFDAAGVSTRVFSNVLAAVVPPAPAANPFTIVAPSLPFGATEIRTYISWMWLLDGAPPAVDKIMVDGGGGAVEVSGDLVGSGTPDLCWGKEGTASYLADVTGLAGVVTLGAANSIAGATDKALGVDPEAYGEGLSILLVYEIPGKRSRNVDVYAGYSSNMSGTTAGVAHMPLTFSKVYNGKELHLFLNAADGQSLAGGSGPGFADEFFIEGIVAGGAVAGTGVVGDAWQGFLPSGPPAAGPPPITDWLYDHANDDVQGFVKAQSTGMVLDTTSISPTFDCIGHSIAAVSFPVPPFIPTVSEWGLMVMTVLVLTAGTVVLGRRRRPAAA